MNYKINFKRLPHQKAIIKSKAFIKALITGYGGGKTITLAHDIIKHSIIDSGIPHMAVSPSYSMAKKTIIPSIYEVLEEHYEPALRSGKDFKYNQSDHMFYIKPWGGKIWIGSGDTPNSLKGPNLGFAGLDEPGLMNVQVYENMIARIRHPKAKFLQLGLYGTPEGLNWLSDLCTEKKPKDFELVRGESTDNTHLPQVFIDNLYDQYDEQLVKAYIKGEFVNLASGSAYYSFSDANILQYEVVPDSSRPLLIGMDFNYTPMCTIIAQEMYIDNKWYVVVFDELYLKNCDTDASVERLLEKYGKNYQYMLYPDPACYNDSAHGSAKSDVKLIRNAFERYGISSDGYIVPPRCAHPKRKDRLNSANKMFKNAKGVIRLLITKSCKNLINDLRKATMEEYLNANFKDPMIGHISDAMGYMIERRYPIKVDTIRDYSNII